METNGLKFSLAVCIILKLYLRVTQTSHQAATGTVESNTYLIIYLIGIFYTQVYLRR